MSNLLTHGALFVPLFTDHTSGRPSFLPLLPAAAKPALVRSRIMSRSSSASSARAPKTWKTSFPEGVVASMLSYSERKPIPRSCSSLTSSMRSRSEQPSRSSFQITTTSPLRANLSSSSREGSFVAAPDLLLGVWAVTRQPEQRHQLASSGEVEVRLGRRAESLLEGLLERRGRVVLADGHGSRPPKGSSASSTAVSYARATSPR